MHAGHHRLPVTIFALIAAVLLPGSLARAQSPSVPPSVSEPRSNVSELISYVPPAAESVGFTDWGRIKASQGAEDVTGASPFGDKAEIGLSTAKDEAAASAFGLAHLREHYDSWAFDAMDLDWEATIQSGGPPLFVLRFRDGFDLRPVAALFDARGFSGTTVPGGTLRSHEMTLSEDWLTSTEFGILNTAFLDDGRTLVLSGDADAVRDVVANHGRFALTPELVATAAVLDGASAALFLPGLDTCTGFTPLPIDIFDPQASPDLSLPTSGLHPYAALGIGYGRPDWSPIGRISFGYPDGLTAQADRAARTDLATTGTSQRFDRPIADALFQVLDSHVDGANLTLDVAPADGFPRRLFDMAYSRDMSFAGC